MAKVEYVEQQLLRNRAVCRTVLRLVAAIYLIYGNLPSEMH